MHLLTPTFLLSTLLLLPTPSLSSKLTITIPSSTILQNPNSLPPDTHATLTSLHLTNPLKAPLTHTGTFVFPDLSLGLPTTDCQSQNQKAKAEREGEGREIVSLLLTIHSPQYIFAPYRVDVDAADGSPIGIWETFRGNEWGNRGAVKYENPAAEGSDSVGDLPGWKERGGEGLKVDVKDQPKEVVVAAKVVGRRGFYEVRPKFSPLALFKNPMILLALVAMGFTFGMPKLMENMDPEMRAEFEKQSRASPISGATQNAMAGGGPASFDLAGWMAGATPRPAPGTGAESGATGAGAATGRENRAARRR